MDKYQQIALIVDDKKSTTFELQEFFKINEYKTFRAHSLAEEKEILEKHHIDILIQDIKFSDGSGLIFLTEVKESYPDIDVIMMFEAEDMGGVFEAMKLGVADYLKKPFTQNDLIIALQRINTCKRNRKKFETLTDQKAYIIDSITKVVSSHIVHISEKSKTMIDEALRISNFDNVNVLLNGETGTGKEVISYLIHSVSARKDSLIIRVNCSAIPDTMFESEFFGYEKGAFTGAEKAKKGFFELADNGTLFLDEIGNMSYSVQSKLLRAIEQQEFYPLGSQKLKKVNIRIISATNRNLSQMIKNDEFRNDLFHRLNGFTINLPTLKERKEDIPQLTKNFVARFAQENRQQVPIIAQEVLTYLSNQDYNGNIRELKNRVERAMIFCDSNTLELNDFGVQQSSQEVKETSILTNLNLQDNEKNLISKALKRTNNNQSKAAKLLGISRHSLIRRLEKYQL